MCQLIQSQQQFCEVVLNLTAFYTLENWALKYQISLKRYSTSIWQRYNLQSNPNLFYSKVDAFNSLLNHDLGKLLICVTKSKLKLNR